MLYTISKADTPLTDLQPILDQVTEHDAVVLWQDGVLQAVKNPQIFTNVPHLFLLENDVTARGLQKYLEEFNLISLPTFIKLTEQYFPQLGI